LNTAAPFIFPRKAWKIHASAAILGSMQEKQTESTLPDPSQGAQQAHPFRINVSFKGPIRQKLFAAPVRLLEKMLFFDHLEKIYEKVRDDKSDNHFLSKFLKEMNVSYDISDKDFARIPKEGPALVIANHPYGGIESAIMAVLLRSVRPDVKVLANYMLKRIPEVHQYCIFVDPFRGGKSKRANIAPLRESIEWIRNGGMLFVFPAGEVSHSSWRSPSVVDPKWDSTIGRIIKITKCPVVPIFIEGHNGPFFQMAGLIHPRLRTMMLPHEMLIKRNMKIGLAVGSPIPFEKLGMCESDADIVDYLRFRTYLLENRNKPASSRLKNFFRPRQAPKELAPIAPPEDPSLMAAEVERLPPEQKIIQNSNLTTYYAFSGQIPHILFEIGRLREISFRLEQEGTGKSIDLDRFDKHYIHLFVWDKANMQVVGAYRLARSDRVIQRFGKKGLYTSTLFRFNKNLLKQISPGLELGRSFIRPECQKNYSALLMLWRGIGRFVVANPRHKNLFGPVSISNDYRSVSRWLLTSYLKHNNYETDLARLIKPRCRPKSKAARGCVQTVFDTAVTDIDTISSVISDIEGDQKGVPVLLKQYLRLGGKLLCFNRDPQFGDVLDGMILVDLLQTDHKQLTHFMGKEGLESFLAYHANGGRKDANPARPRRAFLSRSGRLLRRFRARKARQSP